MKIRKPSFAKDLEKRVKYKKEFAKRGGENNPAILDGLSECSLSPIEVKGMNLSWSDQGTVAEMVCEAVGKKSKTIQIKIHLDRQEKDIIQDIQYLLDLIKSRNLDLSPVKPRWGDYEKYLEVLRLREEGRTWKEINQKISREDHCPDPHFKRVRSLHAKAKRMVKEQGGRI